jgi:RimJ/RimL family protein N-acetyltransferase
MPVHLETSRLILRTFHESDIESFLLYRNDDRVNRYQGWDVPYLREDAVQFITSMQANNPGMPGEWLQIAIERKDNGEMIGDIAFHVTKSNPRLAYLGYSLAHSSWGYGFASEAVCKTLDYLFRVLDLHRVVADCDVGNAASIRLLERLGFRREAHYIESYWLSSKETWGSEYLYAILQREWILR